MELTSFFKSIIEEDHSPVVICDLNHKILYMNDAACKGYERWGGAALLGKSLLACHNEKANKMILKVIEWFQQDPSHNRIYTSYSEKENKDIYMIALRNEAGSLIGYYEKHEYRSRESGVFYDFKGGSV